MSIFALLPIVKLTTVFAASLILPVAAWALIRSAPQRKVAILLALTLPVWVIVCVCGALLELSDSRRLFNTVCASHAGPRIDHRVKNAEGILINYSARSDEKTSPQVFGNAKLPLDDMPDEFLLGLSHYSYYEQRDHEGKYEKVALSSNGVSLTRRWIGEPFSRYVLEWSPALHADSPSIIGETLTISDRVDGRIIASYTDYIYSRIHTSGYWHKLAASLIGFERHDVPSDTCYPIGELFEFVKTAVEPVYSFER